MLPITEKELRASLINASLKERSSLTLPLDFAEINWDQLDYLGFRDRKFANVGYVAVNLDGPVGILLRQAEAKPRSRALCSWCEDVQLPNDVMLFSAKRAGQAGRNGNTIATLICSNFECSSNVRKRPAVAYVGFDVDAERVRRIEALREHSSNFVRNVLEGS